MAPGGQPPRGASPPDGEHLAVWPNALAGGRPEHEYVVREVLVDVDFDELEDAEGSAVNSCFEAQQDPALFVDDKLEVIGAAGQVREVPVRFLEFTRRGAHDQAVAPRLFASAGNGEVEAPD